MALAVPVTGGWTEAGILPPTWVWDRIPFATPLRRSWGGLYPFAGSPGGGDCGVAMPENTAQRGAGGVLDEAHPATLVSVSPAVRAFM